MMPDVEPGAAEPRSREAHGDEDADDREQQEDVVEIGGAGDVPAEQPGLFDAGDAAGGAGDLQIARGDAHDLAEAEGDDGEVVGAQPERRAADDDAGADGGEYRDRDRGPEIPAEDGGEDAHRIGANRKEGGVAEIEQAGIADDDVQAEREDGVEQRVGEDHHGVGAEQRRRDHGGEDHDDGGGALGGSVEQEAEAAPGAGPGDHRLRAG